jgi:hypothetical protein
VAQRRFCTLVRHRNLAGAAAADQANEFITLDIEVVCILISKTFAIEAAGQSLVKLILMPVRERVRPTHRGMGGARQVLMPDWIAQANVEHFKKLLETETDPERRRVIEAELAEEELKLAALTGKKPSGRKQD